MSIVTLSINGSPAPSTYAVGRTYLLSVLVDGSQPLSVEWAYGLRAGPRITGIGTVSFSPVNAESHFLHVSAVTEAGTSAEAIFILSVATTETSSSRVSVTWADPAPKAAGPNTATIHVSPNRPPRSVAWSHYMNGAAFGSGSGATAALGHLQPGIHRLYVTVTDFDGNVAIGESSIYVPSPFGLQSAVVPQQPINSSLVYLGAVYSPLIEGDAITAVSLPFLLTTMDSTVALIPGTTHFQVDLDPEESLVDDEVVVRTQLGNWTLKGPPTGLTDEGLPYDYQHNQPFQPAPLDLVARYAVEAWNVHGLDVSRFRFRVRFRCFIQGDAVYRYTPCEWSSYSGGQGERQRRLMALATSVDLSLDDETPQNRGGSRDIETFTAPDQGYIIGNFETSGRPDRPVFAEDHFYTDQNTVAVYEKDGVPEVEAKATYGMPSVRPCVVDFSKFGQPRIVNKVKRLSGKLNVYMAGGALNQGTVVTVRIYTGKAPGYVDVPVAVAQNVYNPDYAGFVKAGEADLDVSDFEFGRLGVVMDFTVDESNAGTAAPSADPMMTVGEDYYYTKVNSPAIRIDTACFRDPVLQPTFTGTFLGSAVPLTSCNVLTCGPIGTYCYTKISGTGTYNALQPYGYPAPFIAPYGNEASCYGNPVFMGEYTGTAFTTASASVTGYSGTTGCGVAYQYNPCSAASQEQLAVVFPLATTPHAALAYNDSCYTLIGQVSDLRPFTMRATAAETSPVTGCTDIICTGSNPNGGSVDYIDQETLQQVTVAFHHLDRGVPTFGVSRESVSQGYGLTPPGQLSWALWHRPVFPLFTALENASVHFEVTPPSIHREIIVTRNGVRQHYRFYPGLPSGNIDLQTGDVVTLEFLNDYRRYKGMSGEVKWHKPVAVPYLYDSVVFNMPSTFGTLTALGFCGIGNRQDYCFYGTLGATVEMDFPNPDSMVTVKDNSSLPEMVLVAARQPQEQNYSISLPAYQAQRLRNPLTLKFYAERGRVGAHGEMDVWCSTAAAFPSYLRVSNYKSLALADYAYRKTSVQTDTTRRALRVVTETEAANLLPPRIHVDDRGRRLSVVTEPLNDYVYENAIPYSFTGNYDSGISDTVYRNLTGGGGPQLHQLHSVPARPRGLCYVPTQDEIWVTCRESNTVAILSGDGNSIVQLLTVNDDPEGITYCEHSDCVAVVCTNPGIIKMYDAATRNLVSSQVFAGALYTSISTLASYNPVSQNVYVACVPPPSYDSTLFEIDHDSLTVQSWQLTSGAGSLADLFYCQTTRETFVATESFGCFAFNVSTYAFESLGIVSSTCRGACDVPEYGRITLSNAANPPGNRLFTYDPRSRQNVLTTDYSNPVRATGWHPLRRKYYLSTLSIFSGGPGVGIVDRNGVRLAVLQNYDWGYKWAYAPTSRLMFNTVPASFFANNYVAVYT